MVCEEAQDLQSPNCDDFVGGSKEAGNAKKLEGKAKDCATCAALDNGSVYSCCFSKDPETGELDGKDDCIYYEYDYAGAQNCVADGGKPYGSP